MELLQNKSWFTLFFAKKLFFFFLYIFIFCHLQVVKSISEKNKEWEKVMFLFLLKCQEAKMIGHLSLIFLILTIHMSCFHILCTPDLKQTFFSRPLCVHVILCTYCQASRDSSCSWFSRPNHHWTLELGGKKKNTKVSGICNTFHFKQDCSVDLHHAMVN